MKKRYIMLSILLLAINFVAFCDYDYNNYYPYYAVFNSELSISGFVKNQNITKISKGYQNNFFTAQKLNATVKMEKNSPEKFTFFVVTNNFFSSMTFDIEGEPLKNSKGDELNYIAQQRNNYWTFNSGSNPLRDIYFENVTFDNQNYALVYSTMFTITLNQSQNIPSGHYSGEITFTLSEN